MSDELERKMVEGLIEDAELDREEAEAWDAAAPALTEPIGLEATNRCPKCDAVLLGLHICSTPEPDDFYFRPKMEWRKVTFTVRKVGRLRGSID